MVNILRFVQPMLILFIGMAIVVVIAAHYLVKGFQASADPEISRHAGNVARGRNIVLTLLAVAFFWQLIVALSVNEVDRSVIDRSGVQTDRYEVTPTPFGYGQ